MEKINVKNLVLGEVGTTENFTVGDRFADVDLPEEVKVKNVTGNLKGIRLEETVLVTGGLSALLELSCDRCLEKFEKEINFNLEREYEIDRKQESEENLFVDKYLNVDVIEPIREELIMAIPMKKICDESCKGICQKCGQNLNQKECNCK